MLENHQLEQYFWDAPTIHSIADVAARFENPCCLCAPMLNHELRRRNVSAHVLDIDERFIDEANFKRFDLYRPTFQTQKFGVIICDPPFWNVSLSQLFAAIRLLSHHDTAQPLAICYPTRRAQNLCGTFAAFDLKPTSFFPKYVSVQSAARNEIEFYANFEWN